MVTQLALPLPGLEGDMAPSAPVDFLSAQQPRVLDLFAGAAWAFPKDSSRLASRSWAPATLTRTLALRSP